MMSATADGQSLLSISCSAETYAISVDPICCDAHLQWTVSKAGAVRKIVPALHMTKGAHQQSQNVGHL